MEKLTEENWRSELEKHPLLRTTPLDPGQELPELFQALQSIKYEDNDKETIIANYKEEGDYNFRGKKYKDAIISYSMAIHLKSHNVKINAILYSNRAAANYFLENYGSCLKDSEKSLSFDPLYIKSLTRAILSSIKLEKYDIAQKYCNIGLSPEFASIAKDNDILFFKEKLEHSRDKLTQTSKTLATLELKTIREKACIDSLKDAFKKRNIHLFDYAAMENKHNFNRFSNNSESSKLWEYFLRSDTSYPFLLSPLSILNYEVDPSNGTIKDFDNGTTNRGAFLYIEAHDGCNNDVLHWPVVFVYPEYSTYDLIVDFKETDPLTLHMDKMFPQNDSYNINNDNNNISYADWDINKAYTCENIEVYWEDWWNGHTLIAIDPSLPLKDALYGSDTLKQKGGFFIQEPLISFIILSKSSPTFRKKHLDKSCKSSKIYNRNGFS